MANGNLIEEVQNLFETDINELSDRALIRLTLSLTKMTYEKITEVEEKVTAIEQRVSELENAGSMTVWEYLSNNPKTLTMLVGAVVTLVGIGVGIDNSKEFIQFLMQ